MKEPPARLQSLSGGLLMGARVLLLAYMSYKNYYEIL